MRQIYGIKKEILKKANELIYKAKYNQYSDMYNTLSNKKIGFLGKLFGKEKLRQEQMKNINFRVENMKSEGLEREENSENYSVRNTLAELALSINYEVGERYNGELVEFYNNVKSTFFPNNDKIDQEILQKTQDKLNQKSDRMPLVINEKDSTKNKIKALEADNYRLQSINNQNNDKSFVPKMDGTRGVTNIINDKLDKQHYKIMFIIIILVVQKKDL